MGLVDAPQPTVMRRGSPARPVGFGSPETYLRLAA